jgi:hypothetical protein
MDIEDQAPALINDVWSPEQPSATPQIRVEGVIPDTWLRRYLPEHRAQLHAFLLGSDEALGADSQILYIPVEILYQIFEYFLRQKKYEFVGETTPWNKEEPYDNSSGWKMNIEIDPYTKIVSGEGTNINMCVKKKYSGFFEKSKFKIDVDFPETEQKSLYVGTVCWDNFTCEALITIVNSGRTSGAKGDWKKVLGTFKEIF